MLTASWRNGGSWKKKKKKKKKTWQFSDLMAYRRNWRRSNDMAAWRACWLISINIIITQAVAAWRQSYRLANVCRRINKLHPCGGWRWRLALAAKHRRRRGGVAAPTTSLHLRYLCGRRNVAAAAKVSIEESEIIWLMASAI